MGHPPRPTTNQPTPASSSGEPREGCMGHTGDADTILLRFSSSLYYYCRDVQQSFQNRHIPLVYINTSLRLFESTSALRVSGHCQAFFESQTSLHEGLYIMNRNNIQGSHFASAKHPGFELILKALFTRNITDILDPLIQTVSARPGARLSNEVTGSD
eukprot:g13827.t1